MTGDVPGPTGESASSVPGAGHQLPLAVGLRAEFSFADYVPGPNGLAASELRRHARAGSGGCYLWGPPATGKTHLLQAACAERGSDAIYLSLRRVSGHGPDSLSGLERVGLVCLDELDLVIGESGWDLAMFNLYNRIEAAHGALALGARCAPGALDGALPDLRSRFSAGLVLQLRSVGDTERREALERRARQLGFPLGDDVCDYLLTRCSRDMHDLFAVLEALERKTLSAKRRATVPFLKEILDARQ